LVGAPACGKTTLSLNLVTQLKVQNKNAKYILEYPRDYIEKYGHPQHISEQMLIFLGWNRLLENALHVQYDYLICDSPVFISYVYGLFKADTVSSKDRMWILELLDMALESIQMYDKVFYIKPGKIFPIQDNLRHSNQEIQKRIDDSIKGFLDLYKVPYEEITNLDLKKSTELILSKI
jgi:tRNA uridine 5-carbamoylmethylation protein Kti12